MAFDIGSGYNRQTYALTGRKPRPVPYGDILSSLGNYLPELYAAKEAKTSREKELALEEKGLTQSKEISSVDILQRKAELDKQQEQWNLENAASAKAFEENKRLSEATRKETGKQNTISNIIGGAGVGVNAFNAAKGLGLFGGGSTGGGANTDLFYVPGGGFADTDAGFDWGSLGINTATGALAGYGSKELAEKLGASKSAANIIGAAAGIGTGYSGIGKSIFDAIAGYKFW